MGSTNDDVTPNFRTIVEQLIAAHVKETNDLRKTVTEQAEHSAKEREKWQHKKALLNTEITKLKRDKQELRSMQKKAQHLLDKYRSQLRNAHELIKEHNIQDGINANEGDENENEEAIALLDNDEENDRTSKNKHSTTNKDTIPHINALNGDNPTPKKTEKDNKITKDTITTPATKRDNEHGTTPSSIKTEPGLGGAKGNTSKVGKGGTVQSAIDLRDDVVVLITSTTTSTTTTKKATKTKLDEENEEDEMLFHNIHNAINNTPKQRTKSNHNSPTADSDQANTPINTKSSNGHKKSPSNNVSPIHYGNDNENENNTNGKNNNKPPHDDKAKSNKTKYNKYNFNTPKTGNNNDSTAMIDDDNKPQTKYNKYDMNKNIKTEGENKVQKNHKTPNKFGVNQSHNAKIDKDTLTIDGNDDDIYQKIYDQFSKTTPKRPRADDLDFDMMPSPSTPTTSNKGIQPFLPPAPPQAKKFKYVEVVRNKDERAALPAHECDQCEKFYGALGEGYDRNKMVQHCSRHRARDAAPDTPPDYWQMSFPSSETQDM